MKTGDVISNELEIAKWCLENNLIQQGFTILRENLVNYVITKFFYSEGSLKDLNKNENRKNAENMLNKRDRKIPLQIVNLWRELIEYRNDINHCGWGIKNYHSPGDFKQKLKEFIEKFENIYL